MIFDFRNLVGFSNIFGFCSIENLFSVKMAKIENVRKFPPRATQAAPTLVLSITIGGPLAQPILLDSEISWLV